MMGKREWFYGDESGTQINNQQSSINNHFNVAIQMSASFVPRVK